jgi:protein-disulfide isomerase
MRNRMTNVFLSFGFLTALACGRAPDGGSVETSAPNGAPQPTSTIAAAPAKAIVAPAPAQAPANVQLARIPIDGLPIIGADTALITIVEFTDFECPYCKKAEGTLRSLRETYGEDVRIVLANHPLPMHAHARDAALALIAASEQGKAGPMRERLFAHQRALDDAGIRGAASEAGLDLAAFDAARTSSRVSGELDRTIALGKSLGVTGTPSFFVNGRRLTGAQPVATFKTIIDEELTKARGLVASGVRPEDVYAKVQENAQIAKNAGGTGEDGHDCHGGDGKNCGDDEPKDEKVYDVRPGDAPSRGNDRAEVTIVEFTDFECPFCAKADATINALEHDYNGRVRVTVVDHPLPMHEHARLAAKAALAANAQGKYWELHELLFAHRDALDRSSIEGYARSVGLDMARFDRDLDGQDLEARVDAELALAEPLHVEGTPTFFVNGRRLVGAQPLDAFKTAVDRALAEAR